MYYYILADPLIRVRNHDCHDYCTCVVITSWNYFMRQNFILLFILSFYRQHTSPWLRKRRNIGSASIIYERNLRIPRVNVITVVTCCRQSCSHDPTCATPSFVASRLNWHDLCAYTYALMTKHFFDTTCLHVFLDEVMSNSLALVASICLNWVSICTIKYMYVRLSG